MFLSKNGMYLVKVVTVKMVKIENRQCQIRHYNKNIIFIYSEQMTAFPKSKMTKMTMTTLTTFFVFSLVESEKSCIFNGFVVKLAKIRNKMV